MRKNALPPVPQRGGLEHKPNKVDGGLPVPTLVKPPPPPPTKQGDGGK